MRHGTTLALVPLCWIGLALASGPALAGGWSLPDESRGSRVAPLLLLSRPDIRAELHLDADQAAGAERAIAEFHREAAALRGRTDPAAKALRRAVDQGQWTWIEFHLADDQRERLNQLELRWEGPAALATRPEVAKALALTPDQAAALTRAVVDRKARRARTHDHAAVEAEFATRALAVLTDAQKPKWEAMLGPPFTPRAVAAIDRGPGR